MAFDLLHKAHADAPFTKAAKILEFIAAIATNKMLQRSAYFACARNALQYL